MSKELSIYCKRSSPVTQHKKKAKSTLAPHSSAGKRGTYNTLLSYGGKRIQKKDSSQKSVSTISSMFRKNLSRTFIATMAIFYILSFSSPFVIGHMDISATSVDNISTPVSMHPDQERTLSESLVFQSRLNDLTTLENPANTEIQNSSESESADSSLDMEAEVEIEAYSWTNTEPEAKLEAYSEIDSEPEVKLEAYSEIDVEPEIEVYSKFDTKSKMKSNFEVPPVLYLHVRNVPRDANFFWVLEVLEHPISGADIPVDMTSLVDPSLALHFSDRQILDICKMVYCESNNQRFLGHLAVAEDFTGRYRSPYYGTDIYSIIVNGYLGELDNQGNYHAYDYTGREVLDEDISESIKTAVKLALSGSQMTHRLLKAVTEYVNSEYGLQLGNEFFQYGAMYHYSPDDISGGRIAERSFQRVPVSFLLRDHIFYGWWLPKSMALDMAP